MTVDPSQLDKIIAKLEKDMGKGSIHRGSESEDVRRIPMLIPNLDYAMRGGIPIGRFSRFYGEEGAYKSYMAWRVIRNAQRLPWAAEQALFPRIKLARELSQDALAEYLTAELDYIKSTWPDGMEACYHNVELQYDKRFTQRMGVDTDRLLVLESTTVEEIVGAMDSLFGAIHVHVVDSCSNAVTLQELNASVIDQHRGILAKRWGETLRYGQAHFDKDQNTVILIDQVRVDMKTGAEKAAGGRFMRHISSMSVHFTKGKWLWEKNGAMIEDDPNNPTLSGRKVPDGTALFARIDKSRVSRMHLNAAMRVNFKKMELDTSWELANAAVFLGIAAQNGSWFEIKGYGKVQGIPKLQALIAEHEDLAGHIYARVQMSDEDSIEALNLEPNQTYSDRVEEDEQQT